MAEHGLERSQATETGVHMLRAFPAGKASDEHAGSAWSRRQRWVSVSRADWRGKNRRGSGPGGAGTPASPRRYANRDGTRVVASEQGGLTGDFGVNRAWLTPIPN